MGLNQKKQVFAEQRKPSTKWKDNPLEEKNIFTTETSYEGLISKI